MQTNLSWLKADQWLSGRKGPGNQKDRLQKGHEETFGVMDMSIVLNMVIVSCVYINTYVKTCPFYTLSVYIYIYICMYIYIYYASIKLFKKSKKTYAMMQ